MTDFLAREIVDFIYEYDYYEAIDSYASEAQAEAETADLLLNAPAIVVAFLESFAIPVADHLIERISML